MPEFSDSPGVERTTSRSRRSPFLPNLLTLLGLAVCAVFVYLAARDIDVALLAQTLAGANWWYFLLAIISVFATNVAKTVRWWTLFGSDPRRPGFRVLAYGILLGQFANIVLPARTGELARLLLVNRAGGSATFAFGTLVTEKMVETIAMLTLLLLTSVFVPLPAWARVTGVTIAVTAFVLLAIQIGLAVHRERVSVWIERWTSLLPLPWAQSIAARVSDGLEGLFAFARAGRLPALLLWTVVTWFTAVLTNDLTMRALGIELPFIAAAWMLVALQAGIALPASIGRIGAFLYLSQLGLAVFDVDPTTAAGFGLVLYILAYGPQVVLGLIALRLAGLTVANLSGRRS